MSFCCCFVVKLGSYYDQQMATTLLVSVLLFAPLVRAVASDKPYVFFQNRASVYAIPANFSGPCALLVIIDI